MKKTIEGERVVERYQNMIARIAFHYLKSWADAEDIVQDVFIKWMLLTRAFQSEDHEKAWFIRITMNLCKDRLRSGWHKRRAVLESDMGREDHYEIEESPVMEQVLQLSENYRIVIYLHYYEGYSLEDISHLMQRSANTIQTWHRRAKAILKAQLEGDEE